jgi:D-lactate dehydrogenase (cytochrome)
MLNKKNLDEIQNFLVDASNFKGDCNAVYFPTTVEDIKNLIKDSNASKMRVTIAGNGTGLTGGRVPQGGIVISTEKLNKILEIDLEKKTAILQPGVVLSYFQNKLNTLKKDELISSNLIEQPGKVRSFFYPPDPTEPNCFIGATIATNASGAKTFKYGSTRNFVEELEVILANGETIKIKRGEKFANNYHLQLITDEGSVIDLQIPNYKMPGVKNAAGYFCKQNIDAIDLFIGNEGTLGIISKAKLKILPTPFDILSCVVFFSSENNGLAFIEEAREKSFLTRSNNKTDIDARALEFWDENAIKFLLEDYEQIDKNADCAVWFEQELGSNNQDELTSLWFELIKKHEGNIEKSWVGFTETDREKIREFRHAISYKVNEYISMNNFRKLGTDTAVPAKAFAQYYFNCKKMVQQAGINYVAYGHFGNSHLHLNMLPRNDDEFYLGKELYLRMCEMAIRLNGTVSAEHGIGKMKREYLLMMYGEDSIRQMAKLKKQLDPNLILNIGNMFEEKFF